MKIFKISLDKTSDATNAETAMVNETLHFIETSDVVNKSKKVVHEAPLFHNDKLSQNQVSNQSLKIAMTKLYMVGQRMMMMP